jgi:hypothetical protein
MPDSLRSPSPKALPWGQGRAAARVGASPAHGSLKIRPFLRTPPCGSGSGRRSIGEAADRWNLTPARWREEGRRDDAARVGPTTRAGAHDRRTRDAPHYVRRARVGGPRIDDPGVSRPCIKRPRVRRSDVDHTEIHWSDVHAAHFGRIDVDRSGLLCRHIAGPAIESLNISTEIDRDGGVLDRRVNDVGCDRDVDGRIIDCVLGDVGRGVGGEVEGTSRDPSTTGAGNDEARPHEAG